MTIPKPEPGAVIRYSYLWSREYEGGAEEGRKDRPCAIIVAQQIVEEQIVVTVLPVTHRKPENPDDAVEIPAGLKTFLRLDDDLSWIVLMDTNSFVWPGLDLRPAHPANPSIFDFGVLPTRFFDHVIRRFAAALHRRRVRAVRRSG